MIAAILLSVGLTAGAVEARLAEAGYRDASYIVMEAGGGQVLLQAWDDDGVPVAPGSLLKTLAAYAFAERGWDFPLVQCDGSACWLPTGHGRVDLAKGLAESCNLYFRELSERLSPAEVGRTAAALGLNPPPDDASPEAYWGWTSDWRVLPEKLLRAYDELVARRAVPAAAILLPGLRRAARSGTAAGIGARSEGAAFAKTGTATCLHSDKADGDGFAAVVYPADNPRYTMLLRIHGRTGRTAAEALGIVLETVLGR